MMCSVHLIFFFFQAEDGIRDLTVTGVQTCALPICQLDEDVLQARLSNVDIGERGGPVAEDVDDGAEHRRRLRVQVEAQLHGRAGSRYHRGDAAVGTARTGTAVGTCRTGPRTAPAEGRE